jgi:hypothetical protein
MSLVLVLRTSDLALNSRVLVDDLIVGLFYCAK